MKTNKVFKWLYGVFMFLPMLAIGVTCAYVTFNKNAKDSYSQTIERQDISLVNQELPLYDLTFNFSNSVNYTETTYTFYISNVEYLRGTLNATQIESLENTSYIRIWHNTNLTSNYATWENAGTNFGATTSNFTFTFDLNSINVNDSVDLSIFDDYFYRGTSNNTLDNAFYYAVDQFNDSGFNKVDFVSYFDMFYNNTSIWTTFANTYMNYVLFVSLAFFIPRVLLWFINLAFAYSDGFERKSQRW